MYLSKLREWAIVTSFRAGILGQLGGTSAMKETFYKRELPCPPAVEFSSPEGERVFREAMVNGTAAGFFRLIEQFRTQDEPAFCGLASLTMVLNALAIDPGRTWKGPWRWFDEHMLDCCKPLSRIKEDGIILKQVACLARCNGAKVSSKQYGSFTLEELRSEVREVCTSGKEHLIASYCRRNIPIFFLCFCRDTQLGQTGDGHFSPIGAYHEPQDLVLILDTARFKYPPHWVPLPLLYQSMSEVDQESGEPRGIVKLGPSVLHPPSMLYTFNLESENFESMRMFIQETIFQEIRKMEAHMMNPLEVLSRLVKISPAADLQDFLTMRFNCKWSGCNPSSHNAQMQQALLSDLQSLSLHQMVSKGVAGTEGTLDKGFVDKFVILLLVLSEQLSTVQSAPEFNLAWKSLFNLSEHPNLESEVVFLKQQLSQVFIMEGSA